MKKLMLFLIVTLGLFAEPYFGLGGTFSTRDRAETKTDCEASGIGLVGYRFENFSTEARYSQTFSQDSSSYGIYGLKNINDTVYILAGVGQTKYDKIEDVAGVRLGIGLQLKKAGFEIVCRHKEKDCLLNLLFRF